jgi:ring-1,2-phenylacetyl-CoA epoxidase subunit PaaC
MDVETVLAERVLALADDELILGHRNSEWAGHAPILEEDIAFANIALDELGHAQLWYEWHGELTGSQADRLVYFRASVEFRSSQLVELPRGDWAATIVRQYLFDLYETVRLPAMTLSSSPRAAEIAAKIRPEEIYHLRHTSNWVKRLGLGTEESHRRVQRALDMLWPYALRLFAPIPGEQALIELGVMPDPARLQSEWERQAGAHLAAAGLIVPAISPVPGGRDEHTRFLDELVTDLQQVARTEAFGVEW